MTMLLFRRFLLVVLLAAIAVPAHADMRGLAWTDLLTSAKSVCVGRVTAVNARSAVTSSFDGESVVLTPRPPATSLLDIEYLLIVENTASVAGACPKAYRVIVLDNWELSQRPTEVDREYLFFLPRPEGREQQLPLFRIGFRQAWRRLHMQVDCSGQNWEYVYLPELVFVPDELYSTHCVTQLLPLGGSLQNLQRLLRETNLFAALGGSVGGQ